MNPLLAPFNTPFETAPFDKIENEHFLPAIKEGIKLGKEEVQHIIDNPETPNFHNTIVALETSGHLLDRVSSIFYNLNSAETSDEIQALARDISPLLTEHGNDILLNEALFQKIKTVHDSADPSALSTEEKTLLEKTYKSFARNGALLNEQEKEQLRAIDKEKSELSLKFGENVLAENNKYELLLTDEADLEGLPDFAKEGASHAAKAKEKEGWLITLDYPSYIPFMTYSSRRDLREKIYKAFVSKSFKADELDNQKVLKRIAELRHQRALLLGYNSHADFILEERMAGSADNVFSFIQNLLDNSKEAAHTELKELSDFASNLDGELPLQKWDSAYYSEKLKKEKFDISDELLKPYFELSKVQDGVFEVAGKLYDLHFNRRDDIPTYHPEVETYEVTDSNGKHIAVFYADFFPRAGKRQGAWMTSFRGQHRTGEQEQRPHVSIVCNFTKPTESKPSLLTFNEVTTLFHEFGHALHGMLANGTYESLSGTNVYWDFVELPSQVLENWCYEKECLDLFAEHFETGEKLPQEYIERIKNSANFQSGLQMLRQLSFGKLDMAWHSKDPSGIADIAEFENNAVAETDLFPKVAEGNTSCQFSHIFQGGYSAGYYSYKWAEVLDADAFEAFKEKGIFNKEVADAFKEYVLSAGGREHPAELYRKFRGKDPDPKALLRRAGLIG
jgi:Zn-dependent oligopeptidase